MISINFSSHFSLFLPFTSFSLLLPLLFNLSLKLLLLYNWRTSSILKTNNIMLSPKHSQKSDPKSSEGPPQVWIFLYEEMASANFTVRTKTTAEIKSIDFPLEEILKILHLEHSEDTGYSFYITSTSTLKAVVRLISDASVQGLYELYYKKDPIITVIVRPETDPSPNSSQTPSTLSSLIERRKVTGQKDLQNVVVRPRYPPISFVKGTYPSQTRHLDVISLEPCNEKKILHMEYVNNLFEDYPYARNNAKLLIQDIYFTFRPQAIKRRAMLTPPYLIGKPYFSKASSERILAIPLDSDTLKDGIRRLHRQRCDKGRSRSVHRTLTWHVSADELTPLLLHAFGFQEDEVMEKLELEAIQDPKKKGENQSGAIQSLKNKLSILKIKGRSR